jgi:hypothetical protein
MNVYFIDPQYVKPEGWSPLLTYLKVKAAYSFIPYDELPTELSLLIKPYLKGVYKGQDYKKFCDNGVYWLRAHFEKHIRLLSEDFTDVKKVPKEELKKYSTHSAINNLRLDDENCLFLLPLDSSYDSHGYITPPTCDANVQGGDLLTYIVRYCTNILHKYHGNYMYNRQSAFISFDKYFVAAYQYVPRIARWEKYEVKLKDKSPKTFTYFINLGIKNLAPVDFPLVEVDGKRKFTLLRTEEGNAAYQQLLRDAECAQKEAEEYYRLQNSYFTEDDEELNRDFWRECGEAGSNCDSWPGWDR